MTLRFGHNFPLSLMSLLLVLWIFQGCGNRSVEGVTDQFNVKDFQPVTNWNTRDPFYLDFTDAKDQGFILPTVRQMKDGYFRMEFSIKNKGNSPRKFYYKIFYQNESYKFPERDPLDSTKQHPNAWENFYGSWEDVAVTFAETDLVPADNDFHKVTNHFRIVGNPRYEQRYCAEGRNDRWKRNPRVGEYSFLLIVTAPENILENRIPDYIQNISLNPDTFFVNPYFYFLYGQGKSLKNTEIQLSNSRLKVIANHDPGAGIYINPNNFNKEITDKFATPLCGQDSALYRTSCFEQFVHYIDPSTKMQNIPVIEDVLKDDYSKMDYNWNKRFYRKEELISITATTAPRPCETVISDPVNHKITIFNPKSEFGKWQKQNVGVITRHGLTYGKWTVKCKLTELLNRNNLWNGLTNAIWLITMSQSEWNFRRDCSNGGYMANYYGGQQDQRIKNVGYSEIDFEILKTVPYCPNWILPPAYNHGIDDRSNVENWNVPLPEEVLENDANIIVACTNWDMACWQPKDFHDGCWPVQFDGRTYWAHRWDKNYRALTQKTPEPDDELFGSSYYYFQIDWQPDRIIWRIGPSKEKLRVVGYMDERVTSIPNNQMLLIVTQEFHNTKWWIGSMYVQDNIPFPENNILGEIYELTVE